MMSVSVALETFVNKCSHCNHKWRVVCEVDLIKWWDGQASLLAPPMLECPNCRIMTDRRQINDRRNKK